MYVQKAGTPGCRQTGNMRFRTDLTTVNKDQNWEKLGPENEGPGPGPSSARAQSSLSSGPEKPSTYNDTSESGRISA